MAPAEGMAFVTSDNPVYFQIPEIFLEQVGQNFGPFHPLSEITIPLRKDLMLIFRPPVNPSREKVTLLTEEEFSRIHCSSVKLDKADTDSMNRRTIVAADQYVYASEKSQALTQLVEELKGTSQRLIV